MPEIEKIMNIATGDIEKIMNIAGDDIEKVMNIDYPASATWTGTRAVAFGGTRGGTGSVNNIDYKSMSADTDTSDFGDLGHAYYYGGSCSNGTRAVYGGAYEMDNWEYVTVASTGNATDFGETTEQRWYSTIVTNGTIGIQMAGYNDSGTSTTMDYINIASVADVTDWGDLSGFYSGLYYQAGINHATRGLSVMGNRLATGSSPRTTRTGTVAFASTGDAGVDNFLISQTMVGSSAGAESASRALYAGGTNSGSGTGHNLSGIQKLTWYFNSDSLSGAGGFGYLSDETCYFNNGVSDLTRAEFWAGFIHDGTYRTDRVEKFTIDSYGNATDVGNLASGASTYGPAVSSGT